MGGMVPTPEEILNALKMELGGNDMAMQIIQKSLKALPIRNLHIAPMY